jgi:hypothetical protein
MTPREFRQEQEFNYDHFIELTKTGINPNYVNIELFAQEYHKAKLNLLTIPVVVDSEEELCGKSNCNRQKLEGNVYCSYHYDINFG